MRVCPGFNERDQVIQLAYAADIGRVVHVEVRNPRSSMCGDPWEDQLGCLRTLAATVLQVVCVFEHALYV